MGYETRYELSIEPEDTVTTVRDRVIGGLFATDSDAYSLFKSSDLTLYAAKWYEYEADMEKISAEFPDVTFTLYGEGEERDDVWKTSFRNGEAISDHQSVFVDATDAQRLEAIDCFFKEIDGPALRQMREALEKATGTCGAGLSRRLSTLQTLLADLSRLANENYGVDCLIEGADAPSTP